MSTMTIDTEIPAVLKRDTENKPPVAETKPASKQEKAHKPTMKMGKNVKKVTATTMAKETKKKVVLPRTRGLAMDAKITILVKENPHKKGSILHGYYKKYKPGMTVRSALEAGIVPANLNYLVKRQIIRIG